MMGLRIWLRKLFGSKQERDSVSSSLTNAQHPSTEQDSFAKNHNEFALAMYRELRESPGNVFFSPFSIRAGVAMTQLGARGETAAQITEALRISGPAETLRAGLAEIIQRLSESAAGGHEMAAANSLWGQDSATFMPEFLEQISHESGATLSLVDFRRDAEAARVTINKWVEDKTNQKIRDLIPEGSLDAGMRLVLINAIYFKGLWVLKFRTENTRNKTFHLEQGGSVRVPLMHQQSDRVWHMQGAGYQAVDLIYMGGELSMLVVLPDRKDGLRDLEKALSARMLHDCVTQMGIREVKLYLPRFKVTWGAVDMSRQLSALGMPMAFTRFEADFSGINGFEPPAEESLFLSAIFHKTFVEVNEEGTEATAAMADLLMIAGAAMHIKPPPVPVFRADHPFLFAIRDRKSGSILFLGRIADPTHES